MNHPDWSFEYLTSEILLRLRWLRQHPGGVKDFNRDAFEIFVQKHNSMAMPAVSVEESRANRPGKLILLRVMLYALGGSADRTESSVPE